MVEGEFCDIYTFIYMFLHDRHGWGIFFGIEVKSFLS